MFLAWHEIILDFLSRKLYCQIQYIPESKVNQLPEITKNSSAHLLDHPLDPEHEIVVKKNMNQHYGRGFRSCAAP